MDTTVKRITDPCYSDENFRNLLDILFLRYREAEGFERQILEKIIFDVMIEVTPVEMLCMLIQEGKQIEFIDNISDLRRYQRTPKAVYGSIDTKRGYILESGDSVKKMPLEFRIRWKDIKKVLFVDRPNELSGLVSVPVIGLIAKWRLGCYEAFIQEELKGTKEVPGV